MARTKAAETTRHPKNGTLFACVVIIALLSLLWLARPSEKCAFLGKNKLVIFGCPEFGRTVLTRIQVSGAKNAMLRRRPKHSARRPTKIGGERGGG
jgi:hypothetical protein